MADVVRKILFIKANFVELVHNFNGYFENSQTKGNELTMRIITSPLHNSPRVMRIPQQRLARALLRSRCS